MNKIIEKLITAVVTFVVSTLIIYWLYNLLFPDLFGWKTISYWQSVGLYMLSNIFFKDTYILAQILSAIEKNK